MSWVLNDPPPKFGAELAECQRYYLPGNIYGSLIWKYAPDKGAYFIPTPVEMRGTPTIIGEVKAKRAGSLNDVIIQANQIDVYLHSNGIYLYLKNQSGINTDTDSGLYIDGGLSCEL